MERIKRERLVEADGTVVSETPPTLEELHRRVLDLEKWRIKCAGSPTGRGHLPGAYDGPFRDLPCHFSDLRKGDWFTFYGRTFVKTHDHSWFNCVSDRGMTTVINYEDVVQPIINPFCE